MFRIVMRGYHRGEVEARLGELDDILEFLAAQNLGLHDRVTQKGFELRAVRRELAEARTLLETLTAPSPSASSAADDARPTGRRAR